MLDRPAGCRVRLAGLWLRGVLATFRCCQHSAQESFGQLNPLVPRLGLPKTRKGAQASSLGQGPS